MSHCSHLGCPFQAFNSVLKRERWQWWEADPITCSWQSWQRGTQETSVRKKPCHSTSNVMPLYSKTQLTVGRLSPSFLLLPTVFTSLSTTHRQGKWLLGEADISLNLTRRGDTGCLQMNYKTNLSPHIVSDLIGFSTAEIIRLRAEIAFPCAQFLVLLFS